MSGRMYLRGDGDLFAALTQASRVAKVGGERAMRELAEDVMRGSIDRAPRDTHTLENAHYLQRVETSAGVQFHVAIDMTKAPWAMEMHEGWGSHRPYNLGDGPHNDDGGSQAKNAGKTAHHGPGVGWKFLERSFNHYYRQALARLRRELGGR